MLDEAGPADPSVSAATAAAVAGAVTQEEGAAGEAVLPSAPPASGESQPEAVASPVREAPPVAGAYLGADGVPIPNFPQAPPPPKPALKPRAAPKNPPLA